MERGGLACGRIVPADGERDAVLLGGLGVRVSCGCGGGAIAFSQDWAAGSSAALSGWLSGVFWLELVASAAGASVVAAFVAAWAFASSVASAVAGHMLVTGASERAIESIADAGCFMSWTSLMAGGGSATHGTVLPCDICWRHFTIENLGITARQGDFR